MSQNDEKLIHERQEKVRADFGDGAKLLHYIAETMDNFYYRYLETAENKDLHTTEISPGVFGATSFESNMVDALKIKNPAARPGIMELAKSIPKAQKPMVRFALYTKVKELDVDHGELIITSEISWDFPEFQDSQKRTKKDVIFKYSDLGQFRKELALKLEEAAEIFL